MNREGAKDAKEKPRRTKLISALFAEAAKRGISQDQLRNEIAPAQLGKRLRAASEGDIRLLLQYLGVGEKKREGKHDGRKLMNGHYERYEDLGYREGFATPPQLRMIEAMWMGVSNQRTFDDRVSALNSLLKRVVKVDEMRFVESWMVQKVVNAIRHMKRSRP